jgi:hypothetical protein
LKGILQLTRANNSGNAEKTEKIAALGNLLPAQGIGDSQDQTEIEQTYGLVLDDGTIIDAIYDKTARPNCSFAVARPDGTISLKTSVTVNGVTTFPPLDQISRFERGSAILASGVDEYGTSQDLLHSIESHLGKYIDQESFIISLMANYVMMTYVWDAFSAIPYLRFKGQPGTGKSRCLKIMKNLCYRTINLGAGMSKAALYRSIDNVGGTLVIDEAEYGAANLQSDVMKVLNMGYEREGTITLCSPKGKDDWETRDYRVGGPKLLANRHDFGDFALETRCITIETVSRNLAEHIRAEFPREFEKEGERLRNQSLKWRFDHLHSLDKREDALRHLDGRARQLALPIYSVSPDLEFRRVFIRRMEEGSESLREDDPSRIVLEAIASFAKQNRANGVYAAEIRERALARAHDRDIPYYFFQPKKVADLIRGLGFKTVKHQHGQFVLFDPKQLALQCDQFHIKD